MWIRPSLHRGVLLGWSLTGLLRAQRGDELRRLGGCLPKRKGANVARKRPISSDVPPVLAHPTRSAVQGGPDGADWLSHAQARALLRCTPLTRTECSAHRGVPAPAGAPKNMEILSRLGRSAGSVNRRFGLALGWRQEHVDG